MKKSLCTCHQLYNTILDKLQLANGVPLLLLRIFLAFIMIKAGLGKLNFGAEDASFFALFGPHPNTVAWFQHSLGMPIPEVMAFLAGWSEFLGGCFLLVGFLTRIVSIPLMVTMIVAATTVHWDKGWHALPDSTLVMPWEWRTDLIEEGSKRRTKARDILKEHSNYDWITSAGSITILKNGIEFAATYFLMLLVLFFYGGGRYVSLDFWIKHMFKKNTSVGT